MPVCVCVCVCVCGGGVGGCVWVSMHVCVRLRVCVRFCWLAMTYSCIYITHSRMPGEWKNS